MTLGHLSLAHARWIVEYNQPVRISGDIDSITGVITSGPFAPPTIFQDPNTVSSPVSFGMARCNDQSDCSDSPTGLSSDHYSVFAMDHSTT